MREILKKTIRLVLSLILVLSFTVSAFALNTGDFTDIRSGAWYESAVATMLEEGLMNGFDDGTFRPLEKMSASQFVTVTARIAGLQPTEAPTSLFAAGTMQAALEAGWYDWDELPPTGERFAEPIRRELAVKILMRALFPSVRGDYTSESQKISDFASLNGRYYEPVLAAYSVGIIEGDENNNFNPLNTLSRAEAATIFTRALNKSELTPSGGQEEQPVPEPVETVSGGVSENGWLQVIGTQLCNESGNPVVLRGMSSHGLQWYSSFTGSQSIQNTAAYGANVFRVAMYTAEGGYISDPDGIKKKLYAAVDAAIENDLYVIIDWHILSDGNPQTYKEESKRFFAEVSERYKDSPAVLYEICNEPNGNISWSNDIKPYEEELVAVIREKSPDSIILLGSGTWSQDIHQAAASPLTGENLMYTLHFYAGTHGQELRDRIDAALSSCLPVFVSEWGTSRADGSGGVFTDESAVWLDFLEERGISWCNWSLCDKDESSAALKNEVSPDAQWGEEDLSSSGKFVFSRFRPAD